MQSSDDTPPQVDVRKLSIYYIVALMLIALLSISTYFIVAHIIRQSRSDAPLINLAGRQRMLSQKLVKEVLLLNQSRNTAQRQALHNQLKQIMERWTRVHEGLQVDPTKMGLSGGNSETVEHIYNTVNPHFKRIRNALDGLVQADDPQQLRLPMDAALIEEIVAAAEDYLAPMDRIVNQYEQEARARIDRLKNTEALVLAAVLLLLLFEARFIFRPMIRYVRTSFDNVLHINQELQNALAKVKILKGLLPICAGCKKIRDDKGYWNQLEEYIHRHSEAQFSHGICPDCTEKLYPQLRKK